MSKLKESIADKLRRKGFPQVSNENQKRNLSGIVRTVYMAEENEMTESKTPGIRLKKGDLVHVVSGPHCGHRAFIRLTDGNEVLLDLEGRNAGTVVAIEHCEYVGYDASRRKPK
jgi:transcription antitermination factor NusG